MREQHLLNLGGENVDPAYNEQYSPRGPGPGLQARSAPLPGGGQPARAA